MSKEPEAGVADDTGPASTRLRATGSLGWILAAVLAALLAASVVFAVTTYRSYRDAGATQQDRKDALSVAEQFTLRLDALDYQDLDTYQTQLMAVLTPKQRAAFKAQNFAAFAQAYKAIQFSSKGSIRAAGVEDIDVNSASVLVIHDVAVKTKGCVQPPYKRMKVSLRKIDGKWLVDDFVEGVPGCQGS